MENKILILFLSITVQFLLTGMYKPLILMLLLILLIIVKSKLFPAKQTAEIMHFAATIDLY